MDYVVHGILQARILEPFPSPGDLPNPGMKPRSPTLQVNSLPAEPQFSSVQSLNHVRLLATLWTAACHASTSITISWSLPKLMSIESLMPSSHLILCHPLLLPPSVFPSSGSFQMSQLFPIRWRKYWSFSFSISPSNEHSGLISFRMDWLDLLSVQGTLKSLLQHHSSKASILQCSAFFTVSCWFQQYCVGFYQTST